MKRKTFSTNRHTSPKGYPIRNLVSVDLKLVHSNRGVIIAYISTWIKLIKVLSWGNFLLTRSCWDQSIQHLPAQYVLNNFMNQQFI